MPFFLQLLGGEPYQLTEEYTYIQINMLDDQAKGVTELIPARGYYTNVEIENVLAYSKSHLQGQHQRPNIQPTFLL